MANTRVLSGIRSSGTLHWQLLGALKELAGLQHEYECYSSSPIWHALTTDLPTPMPCSEHAG